MNSREVVKMPTAFPKTDVSASLVLKKDGQEPIECAVSVLKIQHGDTLVLSIPGPVTLDAANWIKQSIENYFEGRVKAIVLNDGITIDGVLRLDDGHSR